MSKIWLITIFAVSLTLGIFIGSMFLSGGPGENIESGVTDNQQYTCGMHPEIISDEPGYCPVCEMKLTPIRSEVSTSGSEGKGEIAYWVAPMDPTYIRNEPGKSPMGMDLVPVYEGDIAGNVIKIDPVTSQNMGLRMTKVTKQRLSRTINTVAHITYNEKNLSTINSKISGWVEKLHVDFEGKSIRKGSPLRDIYSPELVAAQNEYLSALKNYNNLKDSNLESARKGAENLLDASRERLLLWDISQSQIDNLEKTGEAQKLMTLYSPVNGAVISKSVIEGDKIKPGLNLFKIADLSTVWAKAHIYEYELPHVSDGQLVELSLPYLPGKEYAGKISFIYPYLDMKGRDVEILIEVPNGDLSLKPNMYANVTINSDLPNETTVIPAQAVIHSGVRDVVFVSLGNGKFLPREVKLGARGEDDQVEVLSGLSEGDIVVVSSQFMLDSESRLREATSKIRAQMASVTIDKDDEQEQSHEGHQHHPEAEMKQNKVDRLMTIEDGVYTCPMDSHSHIVQYGPGKCSECEMKLVPAEETSGRTVYECPMSECGTISSESGRCPKCNMKLKERTIETEIHTEEAHNHDHDTEKSEEHESIELSGVYTCPMDSHSHIVQHGPGECSECGMKLVPAEETSGRSYYTCPMEECGIVASETGECPKCGMKLYEKTIKGAEK
jgi:Cu(I)/Ag(I) efflux system membrane fusion protein/cobalt-zinc-cadmium efflux system membrane fusion protein